MDMSVANIIIWTIVFMKMNLCAHMNIPNRWHFFSQGYYIIPASVRYSYTQSKFFHAGPLYIDSTRIAFTWYTLVAYAGFNFHIMTTNFKCRNSLCIFVLGVNYLDTMQSSAPVTWMHTSLHIPKTALDACAACTSTYSCLYLKQCDKS